MKRLGLAIVSVVVLVLIELAIASLAAEKEPVIAVKGPTVVAFFESVTDPELKEQPDTAEALSDFQHYAASVREPLRKAGIEFHELHARSFQLHLGRSVTKFRTDKGVGYYLVTPGKAPRIEYGVMTDDDLLQISQEYFGIPIK